MDLYTNTLSSNLVDDSHCLFNSGFCRTEHYFVIWTPATVEYCNQIKGSLVYNESLTIHEDWKCNLIKVDIPKFGLTFLHTVKTSKLVKSCFTEVEEKNIFMTPSEYLVVLNNCSFTNALELFGGMPCKEKQSAQLSPTLTFYI